MGGGETLVSFRMPILCGNDQAKCFLKTVYNGNNFVTAWNSQCAAGHKIVLDIDYY
jgi:hypothetical protein